MTTFEEQTAVLERHIADDVPLYLGDSAGTQTVASPVHPGLGEYLFARACACVALRSVNRHLPEPLFSEWWLWQVMEGVLPVPLHMLMSVCGYSDQDVGAESQAYQMVGDALYCEHYPHLNPWNDVGTAKLMAAKDRYLAQGYQPPDLTAAFAADPDPVASLAERRNRPQRGRTGVQTLLVDGLPQDGPVLIDPAEVGIATR